MEATASKFRVKDLTYIALFAALMAICAWIAIPTPWNVSYTLQTMAVFLAVGVLGGKRGTLAVLVYLLLGAVGLPVFSGFRGGLAALLGTTGGYIIGFLASALLMWALERFVGQSPVKLALSMVLALLVCYAFGTAWFYYFYTQNTGAITLAVVLVKCVTPYIIPDLIKIALAVLLTGRLRPHVG
jgi:biotin transport system substrate-specific component